MSAKDALKKARDLARINEMRKDMGLTEIVPKIRECLTCGEKFESKSSNDRVCCSRKERVVPMYGYDKSY